MKRKIDKNKVYALIGKAVTKLLTFAVVEVTICNLAIYILNNCMTVYR